MAHSRRILESGLVQQDLLINIFKVHETARPSTDDKEGQIEVTVSPLVHCSLQLVTAVFNDLPQKTQSFIQNGTLGTVM